MFANQESNKFLSKKSYEIAYAVWRMASYVKSRGFADKAERAALDILTASAGEDLPSLSHASWVAENLLRFGGDLGVFHPENASVVISEIHKLNSAIAELNNAAKSAKVDLREIFSENTVSDDKRLIVMDDKTQNKTSGTDDVVREISDSDRCVNNGNGNNITNQAIRQSSILDKIRQNGNLPDRQAGCRIKELQEILPEASERTIRYDLQNLLSRGLIERVGNGGPATHYRAKIEGNF